jgi:hypothetical protein
MKKLEALKKLLPIVNDNNLACGNYQSYDDNGKIKNCVVGHLLLMGGMTEDDLESIDGGGVGDFYAIDSVIVNGSGDLADKVRDTLESIGFDVKENEDDIQFLSRLQYINDCEGPERLSGHLDENIKKLEEAIN